MTGNRANPNICKLVTEQPAGLGSVRAAIGNALSALHRAR